VEHEDIKMNRSNKESETKSAKLFGILIVESQPRRKYTLNFITAESV